MINRLISELRFRAHALLRRRDLERELDDELAFHLARETEKHVAAGVPRPEAGRRARAAFGGVTAIKEDTREIRGFRPFENFGHDIRYAWRTLAARKSLRSAWCLPGRSASAPTRRWSALSIACCSARPRA